MRQCKVVTALFVVCLPQIALAVEHETVNGIVYTRLNDKWFLEDAREQQFEIAQGIITVTFYPNVSDRDISYWQELHRLTTSKVLGSRNVRRYSYPKDEDPISVLKNVVASELVDDAQLDTFLKFLTNDEYYENQWNIEKIGLDRAWAVTIGDPTVTIAVIDGGTQYDHEDLAPTSWSNPGEIPGNGLDDDGNLKIDDVVGWDFIDNPEDNDPRPIGALATAHGTGCAGIVGAATNNGIGTAGVSAGCSIVHIRANKLSHAADAIDYCRRSGIDIVSMSWAGNPFDNAFRTAIDNAYSSGVLMFAAAGNAGDFPPDFPANHPSVVAIGAVTMQDVRAGYSHHGEIMAPSRSYIDDPYIDEIWTTDNEGTFGGTPYPDNNPGENNCDCPADHKYYKFFSGTSTACPTAAGVAGLILSQDPTLTNIQIRQRLRDSAVDVCDPGVDDDCGYGRVDAYRAVTKWGAISENTTWSGTVWVSGDVVVASSATLTIQPGTIVRIAADDNEHAGIDTDRVELNIEGRLVAIGTLASPIIFESWTPTSSDDWVGFYFDAQSDGGKFTRCIIRDAEYAIESYAEIEVRSSTIESCGAGIVSYDGSAFVKGCNISSEHWGIFASGGDITVRDSAVSDPSASCLQIQNGSSLVARNSQFTDGGNGLVANTNAVVSVDSSCVFDANDVGIAVFNAPSLASIKRSTINSNTSYGIRCDTYSHPLIENSTLRYNSVAIYCTNSSSPTIKGNMIKTNTFGVSAATDANPNIGICCGSGNNTFAYNSQKHAANWNDFEIKAQNNCWNVNTGDCYPPASKILGLVDVDLPQCCSTMAGASEAILEPKPESDDPKGGAELLSVVPNPFNPSSAIHYKLARQERVSIAVYDVAGRIIRELVDRDEEPGSHTVWWDGVDARGSAAASGVYFVKFSAGSVSRTMKMILVK